MSWWGWLIVAGCGGLGVLAGWSVGSFLALTRDLDRDPWDVWEED